MPINYGSMRNYYQGKLLIPIIGGGLLKIKKGLDEEGNDRLLTFEQYLIEDMTGLDYQDENCPKNISQLALKIPSLNSSDITATYKRIPPGEFDTNLLNELVQLRGFDFFISTSYDRKLEDLIAKDNSLNPAFLKPEPIFWNHEIKGPLLLDFEKEPKARKIVYLFGGVSKEGEYSTEEMSINDEDRLESLFSLSLANSRSPSRANNAFSLLEYLRGKVLLFIGNNFQDWFMRFMVRTLYNSPYKNKMNTIYIVNDENEKLDFEKYFFEKFGIQIIRDAPIQEVIDNLVEEIQEDQNNQQVYRQKVFISYDREDLECARRIYNRLKNSGLNVWLDTRDLGIAEHKREIENVIADKDTWFFICLISKSLIDKPEEASYVKKIEWKMAEHKYALNERLRNIDKGRDPFYVVPVAVDDFKQYLHKIPEFMERNSIKDCDDLQLLDYIEKKLKSEFSDS
jgi:hypothetical protein